MIQAGVAAQAPHIARLVAGMRAVAVETGSIRPVDILHNPRPDVNYACQREWARELTGHVRGVVGERSMPRTVLYPFSGADLSSAVAAFPDADTYILVDDNPFLMITKSVLPTQVKSATNFDYNLGTDLQRHLRKMSCKAGGALSIMLGRLHAFLSDVRVREIEYYVEHGPADKQMVHGLMTFVQGESKRSQTLVYLNCPLGNSSALHDELWKAHAAGVDGLLVRGTAGILRNFLGLEARLVDAVRAHRGVVVEGAHLPPAYELSDDVLEGRSPVFIEGFRLSYAKGMRVTLFG